MIQMVHFEGGPWDGERRAFERPVQDWLPAEGGRYILIKGLGTTESDFYRWHESTGAVTSHA